MPNSDDNQKAGTAATVRGGGSLSAGTASIEGKGEVTKGNHAALTLRGVSIGRGEVTEGNHAALTLGSETAGAQEFDTAGPLRVGPLTLPQRLAANPAEIRDAARQLAIAVESQIDDLKRTSQGVNDREHIDSFIDFLGELATGLNQLADALDRMAEAATKGEVEPFLTEDAARVARELGASVKLFLESHAYVAGFSIKIGVTAIAYKFLLLCGFDGPSATAILTAMIVKGAFKQD